VTLGCVWGEGVIVVWVFVVVWTCVGCVFRGEWQQATLPFAKTQSQQRNNEQHKK
jgi:hypothetical protein